MTKQNREPATDPGKMSRRDRISKLLGEIEEKLLDQASKATLSDFIRLTQLERELDEDDPPREIKITWIQRREKPATEK